MCFCITSSITSLVAMLNLGHNVKNKIIKIVSSYTKKINKNINTIPMTTKPKINAICNARSLKSSMITPMHYLVCTKWNHKINGFISVILFASMHGNSFSSCAQLRWVEMPTLPSHLERCSSFFSPPPLCKPLPNIPMIPYLIALQLPPIF